MVVVVVIEDGDGIGSCGCSRACDVFQGGGRVEVRGERYRKATALVMVMTVVVVEEDREHW